MIVLYHVIIVSCMNGFPFTSCLVEKKISIVSPHSICQSLFRFLSNYQSSIYCSMNRKFHKWLWMFASSVIWNGDVCFYFCVCVCMCVCFSLSPLSLLSILLSSLLSPYHFVSSSELAIQCWLFLLQIKEVRRVFSAGAFVFFVSVVFLCFA